MKQEHKLNLLIMNAQLLKDNKEQSEMWFSFNHEDETYLMCVSTTDKPFRGVSGIKAVYEEDNQNEFAQLPNKVISEAYAEVLGESVNYL